MKTRAELLPQKEAGKVMDTPFKSNDDIIYSKFEKIPTEIFTDSLTASKKVAQEIAAMIRAKELLKETCVLGLATGSSPIGVYQELVRMHKEDGLSFKNVVTFNLDEYYPMGKKSIHSYHFFMHEHLFDHIDINPANVNIPDGTIERSEVQQYCEAYERKIDAYGGIDIQLLGIGRTGHIGFNEPGSGEQSVTRLVTLDHLTISDAAKDFGGQHNVPRMAMTMGVGSIFKSRKIVLLAWGEGKATIVQKALEGNISEEVPATFLQRHPKVKYVIDSAAAAELTRIKTPWLVDNCNWDDRLIRKGVVWLCQKLKKPILKLTDKDYNDNGMNDLITQVGSAYDINIRVFNDLQHTITGWPGGKPKADDSQRPERALPFPKRVLIFSPHPDDDVISMGGTFLRLLDNGHEVHVAYQTSGSIAVSDDLALQYAEFTKNITEGISDSPQKYQDFYDKVLKFLREKKEGAVDIEEVRRIKGFIRKGEAIVGAEYLGAKRDQLHFMHMPFYETGKAKKNPISEADIKAVVDLIQEVKPHQIYAAGDLSDPHGTHRLCLDAVLIAIDRLKQEKWMKDCWIWLYRGAWQEWELDQVDMAVPISPGELMKKRISIFKHQSQNNGAMFPGNDSREFWQRAEDRNRGTAQLYDAMGMAEYEAIEAFVRYLP